MVSVLVFEAGSSFLISVAAVAGFSPESPATDGLVDEVGVGVDVSAVMFAGALSVGEAVSALSAVVVGSAMVEEQCCFSRNDIGALSGLGAE